MPKLIFLDVGAHEGHTLEEVTTSKYRFDKIYAFEPMMKQYKILVDRFSSVKNLEMFNYGLADKTGVRYIYGTNADLGASIYQQKRDLDDRTVATECRFVEASQFFKEYIDPKDIVVVKLNCEGSEIIILNNLIDTGEINKINNVMIDFDVRKVDGMEHEEPKLLHRFEEMGFKNYCLCDNVMVGRTHQDRIANWLDHCGVDVKMPTALSEIAYWNEHCRNCLNTFDEEQKHYIYAKQMELGSHFYDFEVNGVSVLDVGGGPCSMLLKCHNLARGKIVDPLASLWPEWVRSRYACANITWETNTGENMNESGWDEVWVYNCLQHVDDPEKVLVNCKKSAKIIRIFEWVDVPVYDGHKNNLSQKFFENMLGPCQVSEFAEKGCYGKAVFGKFSTNPKPSMVMGPRQNVSF